MPRPFREDDRQAIRKALMVIGLKHFERHGVRRARVEDICGEAGIAKGSFYAFFPSKEELFMTLVDEREQRHMADMLAFIAAGTGSPRQRAGGFFDLIREKLETDPVLNLVLRHGEIAHLVRKLGEARFEPGRERDRAFARDAARRWNKSAGTRVDADDLLGMMTIALSLSTHRANMSPEQYASAAGLLRELFVDRLAGRRV